ncbi:hypothetical protein, partial [uncultured Alistipes sp.]|uniref:hypothetical protein n=1 Tax=uncultured Alistipes sp. TaxID=538949 RepID=UPI0026DFD534
RFSEDERRTRETDVRMVLGTFCHQKVQKSGSQSRRAAATPGEGPLFLTEYAVSAGCVREQIS